MLLSLRATDSCFQFSFASLLIPFPRLGSPTGGIGLAAAPAPSRTRRQSKSNTRHARSIRTGRRGLRTHRPRSCPSTSRAETGDLASRLDGSASIHALDLLRPPPFCASNLAAARRVTNETAGVAVSSRCLVYSAKSRSTGGSHVCHRRTGHLCAGGELVISSRRYA